MRRKESRGRAASRSMSKGKLSSGVQNHLLLLHLASGVINNGILWHTIPS